MITSRPPLWSAVGGVVPNPVVYTIASANPFVEVVICAADDQQVARTRQRTFAGQAKVDISSFLRSKVKSTMDYPQDGVVQRDYNATFDFYIDYRTSLQEGFTTDRANLRHAVNAALDSINGNYDPWVIRNALAGTEAPTTAAPTLPQTTAPFPLIDYQISNPRLENGEGKVSVCCFAGGNPADGDWNLSIDGVTWYTLAELTEITPGVYVVGGMLPGQNYEIQVRRGTGIPAGAFFTIPEAEADYNAGFDASLSGGIATVELFRNVVRSEPMTMFFEVHRREQTQESSFQFYYSGFVTIPGGQLSVTDTIDADFTVGGIFKLIPYEITEPYVLPAEQLF